MAFHRHILEVKDYLRKSEDERIGVMLNLTEPKGSQYLKEYEAMWNTLLKETKKHHDSNKPFNSRWVFDFLDSVVAATDLPSYFYMNGSERRDLISKIREHTNALEEIYTRQRFNQNLISNDGQFFHGFFAYEVFEDKHGKKIEHAVRPKVSVVDTLQFFAERAEEDINESGHKGKAGKNIEAIRFIRILAERNIQFYERPLNSVLKTAAFAIYGIEYSESDISNLRNRR